MRSGHAATDDAVSGVLQRRCRAARVQSSRRVPRPEVYREERRPTSADAVRSGSWAMVYQIRCGGLRSFTNWPETTIAPPSHRPPTITSPLADSCSPNSPNYSPKFMVGAGLEPGTSGETGRGSCRPFRPDAVEPRPIAGDRPQSTRVRGNSGKQKREEQRTTEQSWKN